MIVKNNWFWRVMLGSVCLPLTAVLAGVWSSTTAAAQAEPKQEYRVGNLIENGDFSDPKGWKLDGFLVIPNRCIALGVKGGAPGSGTATTTFQGPDGHYKIRFHYLDEGDGVSTASLSVGDRNVGAWKFYGMMVTSYRWKEFDHVAINKGDEIKLFGRKNQTEQGCITGVEILPSTPPPPGIEAADVEAKEYSMNLVPLPQEQLANNRGEYLIEPGPVFTGEAGTYLIYLKENEPFRLRTWAQLANPRPSLQYTLTKVGADEPVASESLISESIVRGLGEGLYELKVSAAPGAPFGRIKIKLNVPAVARVPAPKGEVRTEGYFFVPAGTKVLSVQAAPGRTNMLDAAGKVMLDEGIEKLTTHVVTVPAGSDNQVWFYQGQLTAITGVPPYVAARRDAMLVPKEVLQ